MPLWIDRKKLFNAISSTFIIVIFLTEVALSKDQTLTRIQQYLLDMNTLEANFSQINDTGDILSLIHI